MISGLDEASMSFKYPIVDRVGEFSACRTMQIPAQSEIRQCLDHNNFDSSDAIFLLRVLQRTTFYFLWFSSVSFCPSGRFVNYHCRDTPNLLSFRHSKLQDSASTACNKEGVAARSLRPLQASMCD